VLLTYWPQLGEQWAKTANYIGHFLSIIYDQQTGAMAENMFAKPNLILLPSFRVSKPPVSITALFIVML
jgi:hypothetical protein